MDPTSQDTLRDLMDDFDNHIIEFTYYSQPCGMLNKRLVVWEVRAY